VTRPPLARAAPAEGGLRITVVGQPSTAARSVYDLTYRIVAVCKSDVLAKLGMERRSQAAGYAATHRMAKGPAA
jgi:hypothetical protein